MNLSFYFPTNFKENLLRANLDFDTNVFKAVLVRAGFSFSSNYYLKETNVTTSTGAINYHVVASTKTITRETGSFITDGFVPGNVITLNGTNKGPYLLRVVNDLTMKFDLYLGSSVVNEGSPYIDVAPAGAGAEDTPLTWVTYTIQSVDEMRSITSNTAGIGVTGTATTSTLSRASGSFITDGFVAGTVFEGTGTNAGPFVAITVAALSMVVAPVGSAAAVVDEVAAAQVLSNGYSLGGQTVTMGLDGSVLTLETVTFDWSAFGSAILEAPGMIIYNDTTTPEWIVAYARFSPWVIPA